MFRTKILFTILILFTAIAPVFAQGVYEAWVARYDGPGNSDDRATALAVDGSGNVYVTGSFGSGTSGDYATIKYNSNGDTLWVRRYNGPGNSYDYAYALAVDGSGNVYVTGSSYGSGTTDDYTTIKYNSNGDTLWVRRYNGPENNSDYASALEVDGSGNVYVTGYSWGGETSSDYDYATIKYNSNGDTLWVRRYNGPGNGFDQASALEVDGSGNVYVTGYSVGSGTSNDYATLKYNSNGDTLWVRRYNGPGNDDVASALEVDGSGNVYVTGYSFGSGTSYDYATIKYDSNGDTLWVKRYDGPENVQDVAYALEVDGSGNVYVTGGSFGSGTNQDYATIKYNSNGDTLWVKRYNGPGNDDVASALEVDGSGNVYVTGYSFGSGTSYDYATIKYDSNGDTLWVKRYDGPENVQDVAYALEVDGSGNVYVTGSSFGSGTNQDYATIKYSPCVRSGNLNGDGKVNITDIVYLVNIVFKSWANPGPGCLADVNGDSMVSLADVIFLFNYVMKSGPSPVISGACCLSSP